MTPTVAFYVQPDFNQLFEPEEQLVWTGKSVYGHKLFQFVAYERAWHLIMLAAILMIWLAFFFVDKDPDYTRFDAIWYLGGWTFVFATMSFLAAYQRKWVLKTSIYMLTNHRAIVCRKGRNWRDRTGLYVVSLPLIKTYPYRIIRLSRYGSLEVGNLLSANVVQLLG